MKKDDIEENVEEIEINTEFIKLDQLLKWANFTASGAEAKSFIQNGEVKVNGEIETRRGNPRLLSRKKLCRLDRTLREDAARIRAVT